MLSLEVGLCIEIFGIGQLIFFWTLNPKNLIKYFENARKFQ